jgi:hypothetical protein
MPIIINFARVNADWKEVCYSAVKCKFTFIYFTPVFNVSFAILLAGRKQKQA